MQLFMFPATESDALPDPSVFFSRSLLSSPLPTNSFFQNFVLKNGDQPEYIHPYLIKLSSPSLSLCYPSKSANSDFIYQVFKPDLTIGSGNPNPDPHTRHVISSFSDLSVTVDLPNLRFCLVRGSPYVTCSTVRSTNLSIFTIHEIVSFSSNNSNTKHALKLKNNQTWLIYASSPIKLNQKSSVISSAAFFGVIRIALSPYSDIANELVLDRFCSCYPLSGEALFNNPFSVEYKWEKEGEGDLLMLAHLLHLKLLSNSGNDSGVSVLNYFRLKSIDGDLVGVVGDSWKMRVDPVSVTWHSIRGVREDSFPEIIAALSNDVACLDSAAISATSSYFYGKLIARAARLALIAEEVRYPDAIPRVLKFLKNTIEPWLEGTFPPNGFVYDSKWGGILTKQGAIDSSAEFGFGLYNNHHKFLGYFVYAIAVLAKFDPVWGRKFKRQACALMEDYMTMERLDSTFTRLRCFDLYKLHSWAGGLVEFADGRHQENTGEAVNAYYSAALMGFAFCDVSLVSMGSTLAALEMQGSKTWWHVREGERLYDEGFCKANKLVGVAWANKRDNGLWFADRDRKECRLGIHVLPLVPITEMLFSNAVFGRDVVNWCLPALKWEGVKEGWKGFVFALKGLYDKGSALEDVRKLKGFDDGNSLSNLLWWIHSRGD